MRSLSGKPAGAWPSVSLVFIALLWGSGFPLVKNAIEVLPPNLFNALRFDVAALALLGYTLFMGGKWTKKAVSSGVLVGFFLFGGYCFQTVGMQWTSSTNAAFIVGLTVIWVPILLWLLYGNKISRQILLATLLAVVALYCINGGGFTPPTKGDLFQIIGTLFFSAQIVALSRISPKLDPLVLNFTQMAAVAGFFHLTSLATETWTPEVATHLTQLKPWVSIAFAGVVFSAFAFAVQIWAMKRVNAVSATLILATEPLFGAAFSFFFEAHTPSLIVYFGGVLLFASVILAELKFEKKVSESIAKNPVA